MAKPFELSVDNKSKRRARENYEQPRANVSGQRPNWAPGIEVPQAPTGSKQLPALPRAPVAKPFSVR